MKKIKAICCLIVMILTAASCADDAPINQGGFSGSYVTPPESNPTHVDAPIITDEPSGTTRPHTPVSSGETRITFLSAGDNIIHENVFLDARSRAKAGEKYNFIDMYAGIADLVKSADIALINQETPICGDEMGISGYPNFNSPEAAGDALIDLGFDIINLANNHMLDKRAAGYEGSLKYWAQRADKVMTIGGHVNKADYENIRVYEEQGVKIAFLSYTYGTNNMTLPSGSQLYIPYINEAEITRMIDKAETMADLVFVVMHWGNDSPHTVTNTQKSLATALTEAGADVIIGMHPHGVQPMEWRTASDGTKTLVTYSMGNLISTQYDNYNLVGGILTFDIVKDKDGNITIEHPIYNPTVTHYNKQRLGLQVYLMEDYTEELVSLHGNPNYGQTADSRIWTMAKIRGFVTSKIPKEFLPDFLK